MSTVYTNDLRLKEIGTGLESGTWGTSTNTNLSLIAEAFSYQTEATFSSDANVTTTIADGTTDKYRAMYVKVTSGASLTATRILTIGPNTCSKVIFIENATSGGQTITVKQGSGATQNVANGKAKLLILEGTGASAAVIDALDKIELGSNATIGGVAPINASSTTTFTNKTFDANGTGNSISNIENADISASAAIAFSKMANLTINRALTSNSDGDIQVSNVTADEINYLDGVSSNIQGQLNNAVTASSSTTFTNKGGNISQWTNNSGYITSYASTYSQSASSGYIRFANGMQMCWARIYSASWTPSWTYPLAFPNAVVSLSKHDERTSASGNGSNYIYSVSNSAAVFTTSVNPGYQRVIAIGY